MSLRADDPCIEWRFSNTSNGDENCQTMDAGLKPKRLNYDRSSELPHFLTMIDVAEQNIYLRLGRHVN